MQEGMLGYQRKGERRAGKRGYNADGKTDINEHELTGNWKKSEIERKGKKE